MNTLTGLGIVAAIAVALFLFSQSPLMPFAVTLSVDEVTLNSSDPLLNGETLQIVFTANQTLNESFRGRLTSTAITNELGNQVAGKGFTFDLSPVEQNCEYNIEQQAGEVYRTVIANVWRQNCTVVGFCAPTISIAEAHNRSPPNSECGYYTGTWDVFCLAYETSALASGIIETSADTIFETTATLTIDGETPMTQNMSNVISTSGGQTITQPRAVFGNTAYMQWEGNLVSGFDCASPRDQDMMALWRTIGWKFVREANFDNHRSTIGSIYTTIDASRQPDPYGNTNVPFVDEMDLREATAYNNNQVWAMVSQVNNWRPPDSAANAIVSGDQFSGKAYYRHEQLTQYPVFSLYIKATELEIVVRIPSARINSVNGGSFVSSDRAPLTANVTNTGQAGYIEMGALCDSPFRQFGANTRQYFNAGETRDMVVQVTGSCTQQTTVQCRGLFLFGASGRVESNPVNFECTPLQVCTPNVKECRNNMVKQCNAEGTGWNLLEDCTAQGLNCGTDASDQPACVADPTDRCGNGLCEPFEQITCPRDCPTELTHTECRDERCIEVLGAGTSTCEVDADCGGVDERALCLARPGEFPFVTGYTWQVNEAPFWGWVIGWTTTGQCVPLVNWGLIIGLFVVVVGFLVGLWIWKKK